MSQFPNPGMPGSEPNPFAASPPGYQPKKSNTWLYILLGVGGVSLLVCCGCVGLGYFGFNAGMGIVGAQLKNQLNSDPTAQQHLGTVSSVEVDIMASGEEQQKRGGQQVLLFHVVGDKGTGDVIAQQTPGQQTFTDATLRLPSGEEVELGF